MLDRFNRDITYMRISVIDRCNLRCDYCAGVHDFVMKKHSDILSYEQIRDIVQVAAELGITKVRLTGGEPLIRKNIEIVTSLERPLSPVFGDEGTLTEALVNIGNNAIKYSHMGSQVSITAKQADDQVVISVSDTGVGIPEEDLPFIFDDFYRAKSGQATAGGAGLGLAICRRIVETHNGSISAESELGKGSTLVIRLPAYESNPDH